MKHAFQFIFGGGVLFLGFFYCGWIALGSYHVKFQRCDKQKFRSGMLSLNWKKWRFHIALNTCMLYVVCCHNCFASKIVLFLEAFQIFFPWRKFVFT